MKLKITVDGNVYEVDVEVSAPEQPHPSYVPPAGRMHAAPPTPSLPAPAAHESAADENRICRSPISGVVVSVAAAAGQEIAANDVLMVLEAMKMETVITSPMVGKVAKVNVARGDAVQGGQVLVEFE